MREILIGSYRGLLPIAPLMAVTPIGLALLATDQVRALRRRSRRGRRRSSTSLLNASYFYWEGGWAFGPRQVMPALPFLALGLAPLWDGWRPRGRVVLAGAWLWGAALTLVAVSTTPQPPASIMRPVSELMVPAFLEGHLALNTQRFTDYRADEDAIWRHADPTVELESGDDDGADRPSEPRPARARVARLRRLSLVGSCPPRPTCPARLTRPTRLTAALPASPAFVQRYLSRRGRTNIGSWNGLGRRDDGDGSWRS